MGLFDNKPLTEAEVLSRLLCECGETYGEHCDGGDCVECGCTKFVKKKEGA